jgi:hypothetical protein
MDPISTALTTGIVDLSGTAATFGAGAIASAISGNPFYQVNPASANIGNPSGVVGSGAAAGQNGSGILILAVILYFVLKG